MILILVFEFIVWQRGKYYVCYGGFCFDAFVPTSRVPQGWGFEPLLFLMYKYNIYLFVFTKIWKRKKRGNVGIQNISTLFTKINENQEVDF